MSTSSKTEESKVEEVFEGYIKSPFKGFIEIQTISGEIFLLSIHGLSIRKTSAWINVAHNSSNSEMQVFIKFTSDKQSELDKWYNQLDAALREAAYK